MSKVVWTPAAEQDIESIFMYIGREQRSPAAAARVIRQIADKADIYASQPLLADARPEFGAHVRAYYVRRYVVIDRPATDGIEVLRIIHGSRDVYRVFQQPEK